MTAASVWLRRLAFAFLTLVLSFGGLSARVLVEGERELEKSDAAWNRGDLRDATLYARRAATLYAPGAPHVRAAYARLSAIAIGAEASNQVEVARLAWEAMRGAALESRHVFTPHAAELALSNANLSRLDSGSGDRGKVTELLSRDDAPRAPWILLLGLGFALCAAGMGLLAGRGLRREDGSRGRILAISAALVLIGAACWTLAVYRA